MELKIAQEIAEELNNIVRVHTPYPEDLADGLVTLNNRITELGAQRDELVGLCKEAVTFPAEYRKHRILLQQLRERIRDE